MLELQSEMSIQLIYTCYEVLRTELDITHHVPLSLALLIECAGDPEREESHIYNT